MKTGTSICCNECGALVCQRGRTSLTGEGCGLLGEQLALQQEAGPYDLLPPRLRKLCPLFHTHKLSPKIQQGHFDFGSRSPESTGPLTSLLGS